ncbi:5-methyltetrahydropteroyltriglutamate--homocysteine S-methyltransferase [Mycetohabitans endofungorum]|uniref:5-methyltetrahydropteroyltriglutamate-- homocysteine S-methyltransferase n=1 Tax=Mycetohabitans endofungorum TaxID=417203 RepID=UPI0030D2CB98
MIAAHVLGFPRIGAQRELQVALQRYWQAGAGEHAQAALLETGRALRREHWRIQRDAGLDFVTVGDFAWYDHVLTTLVHLGGLPARFGFEARNLTLAQYLALARGHGQQPPLKARQWFDTRYHYLVPEFDAATRFDGGVDWLLDELRDAQHRGHRAKVVLVGPLTLLWLANVRGAELDRLDLLPRLLPAYQRLLAALRVAGVEWVQLDEPVLTLDLPQPWCDAAQHTYQQLSGGAPRILLATYFGDVSGHASWLKASAVDGVHLDLVRAPQQLSAFIEQWPRDKILSCGIVDGDNVWRNDLAASLHLLEQVHARLGDNLWVASSCSLLHVPLDLAQQTRLDDALRSWMAFAVQKTTEIALLRDAVTAGRTAPHVAHALDACTAALNTRRTSARVHHALVQRDVARLEPAHTRRAAPYAVRESAQRARFNLPVLPTTALGPLPRADAIRTAHAAYRQRELTHFDYLEVMRAEIRHAVERQHALGLDVLVHGEAERDEPVEYFAEQLWGMAVTDSGWVQVDGCRCVKPALIYGDVYAPEPLTVGWVAYAQSLTDKPVKGMLTGPATMLQRAFVRDDQPRAMTALQVALVLRAEVAALQAAGIGIIQIDEPVLGEGLPLRQAERDAYLDWVVRAFQVATGGAANDTQIHVHLGDAVLDDMLPAIAALDADVILFGTGRAARARLDALAALPSPSAIGTGIDGVHVACAPDNAQMLASIDAALTRIPAPRLWVSADCGATVADWHCVQTVLSNLVAAARTARAALRDSPPVRRADHHCTTSA